MTALWFHPPNFSRLSISCNFCFAFSSTSLNCKLKEESDIVENPMLLLGTYCIALSDLLSFNSDLTTNEAAPLLLIWLYDNLCHFSHSGGQAWSSSEKRTLALRGFCSASDFLRVLLPRRFRCDFSTSCVYGSILTVGTRWNS